MREPGEVTSEKEGSDNEAGPLLLSHPSLECQNHETGLCYIKAISSGGRRGGEAGPLLIQEVTQNLNLVVLSEMLWSRISGEAGAEGSHSQV